MEQKRKTSKQRLEDKHRKNYNRAQKRMRKKTQENGSEGREEGDGSGTSSMKTSEKATKGLLERKPAKSSKCSVVETERHEMKTQDPGGLIQEKTHQKNISTKETNNKSIPTIAFGQNNLKNVSVMEEKVPTICQPEQSVICERVSESSKTVEKGCNSEQMNLSGTVALDQNTNYIIDNSDDHQCGGTISACEIIKANDTVDQNVADNTTTKVVEELKYENRSDYMNTEVMTLSKFQISSDGSENSMPNVAAMEEKSDPIRVMKEKECDIVTYSKVPMICQPEQPVICEEAIDSSQMLTKSCDSEQMNLTGNFSLEHNTNFIEDNKDEYESGGTISIREMIKAYDKGGQNVADKTTTNAIEDFKYENRSEHVNLDVKEMSECQISSDSTPKVTAMDEKSDIVIDDSFSNDSLLLNELNIETFNATDARMTQGKIKGILENGNQSESNKLNDEIVQIISMKNTNKEEALNASKNLNTAKTSVTKASHITTKPSETELKNVENQVEDFGMLIGSVWLEKPFYDDAEKKFFEQLTKSNKKLRKEKETKAKQIQEETTLKDEGKTQGRKKAYIEVIEEIIETTEITYEVVPKLTEKHLLKKISSVEKENRSLHQIMNDVLGRVALLEDRLRYLENKDDTKKDMGDSKRSSLSNTDEGVDLTMAG